jgi:hypothetical protein
MAEEHTTAAIAEGPHQPLLGLGVWQAAQARRPAGPSAGRSRQDPGRAGNLTTITVTRPMGLPRHRQPHRLVGDGSLAYLRTWPIGHSVAK